MLKVAVRMPAASGDAGELVADVRALEAAGAHAVWLPSSSPDQLLVLGAVAFATQRIGLAVTGPPLPAAAATTLRRLSGGRTFEALPSDERWNEIAVPADRAAWAAALAEHERGGADGVILPWDPRLIDLLRNPGEDDRTDLLISTG